MASMPDPRTYVLELPAGTPILTANQSLHFHDRSDRVEALAAVVTQLVRSQRPPPFAGQVDVLVEYASPPHRKADRHPLSSQEVKDAENIAPTSKAAIDALVRAGVLVNDSRKWVRQVTYRLAAVKHPRGLVRITITEVVEDAAQEPA